MSQQGSQGQTPSSGNAMFAVKLFAIVAAVLGAIWALDKAVN